jgi:hypothetical protein
LLWLALRLLDHFDPDGSFSSQILDYLSLDAWRCLSIERKKDDDQHRRQNDVLHASFRAVTCLMAMASYGIAFDPQIIP